MTGFGKSAFIRRLCGVVCGKTDLNTGRIIDLNLEGASGKKKRNTTTAREKRHVVTNVIYVFCVAYRN